MKILILVAHPDDETIICGGTIDKLVRKEHQVFVTFLTNNDQAYFGSEKQYARIRRTKSEGKASSKQLNFSANFLDFVDMDLNKDKGKLIRACMDEIRRVKPDAIITHHSNDKHIDHRTLGEIVPEANFQSGCKLCGGKTQWSASLILQGEVDLEMTTPFEPQVISILSENNVKQKEMAFNCYKSVKDEHKASQNWLNTKLRICLSLRGSTVGEKYGEAYLVSFYSPLSFRGTSILTTLLEK